MKILFASVTIFICFTSHSFGQGIKSVANSNYKTQWTTNPFDHKVFIENKGQFDGAFPKKDKVLYGARIGKVFVYITTRGLVYKYTETPKRPADADDKKAEPDKDADIKPIQHYLYATWQGSTDTVSAIAAEEQTNYYAYAGKAGNIKANIFRKVTCRNVYPGIDIEYIFPKNKGGIEYSLIVHPGADVSLAKLKYSGEKNMHIDASGNMHIKTAWGDFTDHTPEVYYREDNSHVTSAYHLNGSVESFTVSNTDTGKTMVIDPWTTNWTQNPNISTTGTDAAYDVDYDYNGNVYACGADDMELVKMNSAGTILWTFIGNSIFNQLGFYGGFCVDKISGSCYMFDGVPSQGTPPGPAILKLNNAGIYVSDILNTTLMFEYWRGKWDRCNNQIVIAGGGASGHNNVIRFDTNLATPIYSNPFFPSSNLYQDLVGMAFDPSGTLCYMASSSGDETTHNNYIVQMPLPAVTTPNYNVPDNFNFVELGINYVGPGGSISNGMNCMAATPKYVYMYDGINLKQYNALNGSLAASATLPAGTTSYDWGGIDADLCDNLYIGNQRTIYTYNSSLAPTGSFGPLADTIYDIKLGQRQTGGYDSILYVCGDASVSSIKIMPPTAAPGITKTRVPACGCNSTATATLDICGSPAAAGISYLWSDGQTTQTATGLCPGNTYTVTVSLGCAMQWQDTFNFPPGYVVTPLQTPATCTTPGTASVTIAGGTLPYTYLWGNGATTSGITGLEAGSYSVIVSDDLGCPDTLHFTITGSIPPVITVTPLLDTVCAGISVPLTAAGGVTYSWKPTAGLSCSTCAATIATPNTTTAYTITGTDANGCSNTAETKITVYAAPVAAFTYPYPLASPTVQFTDNSTDPSGIQSWAWNFGVTGDSTGTTQNPLFTYPDTGTYCPTLTVVNTKGCKDSVTNCLVINPALNLYIPDAFTPNGNNLNDNFGPEGTGMASYSMIIFDRWGNKIYSTTESQTWNGSVNGAVASEGIYIYQITALDHNNFKHNFAGKITLLR